MTISTRYAGKFPDLSTSATTTTMATTEELVLKYSRRFADPIKTMIRLVFFPPYTRNEPQPHRVRCKHGVMGQYFEYVLLMRRSLISPTGRSLTLHPYIDLTNIDFLVQDLRVDNLADSVSSDAELLTRSDRPLLSVGHSNAGGKPDGSKHFPNQPRWNEDSEVSFS